MHAFINPEDGRLALQGSTARELLLYGLVADLPPVERRVIRWLHGINCEELPVREIADRMNLSETEVWRYADRATDLLGQLVVIEAAA